MAQSPRESYLTFLEQYEYNLALNSQWVLIIHSFPQFIKEKIAQLEAVRPNDWLLLDSYDNLTSQKLHASPEVGCFFIDSVSIDKEGYNIETPGQNALFGGFIKPGVAGQRDQFSGKKIITTFRETNLDFVEIVMRPWVIAAGYYGYFAYQNENERVRIPRIQLISFGRQKHTPRSPYDGEAFRPIRKVYNFYNCAPTDVDGKKYNYNEDTNTSDLLRSVSWTYDNYSINITTK